MREMIDPSHYYVLSYPISIQTNISSSLVELNALVTGGVEL